MFNYAQRCEPLNCLALTIETNRQTMPRILNKGSGEPTKIQCWLTALRLLIHFRKNVKTGWHPFLFFLTWRAIFFQTFVDVMSFQLCLFVRLGQKSWKTSPMPPLVEVHAQNINSKIQEANGAYVYGLTLLNILYTIRSRKTPSKSTLCKRTIYMIYLYIYIYYY